MKGRIWKLPKLREAARAIFQAGLKAVDPEEAVLQNLERKGDRLRIGSRTYRLSQLSRVFVVGAGKACAPMARAVEQTLGSALTAGIIVVKYGHSLKLGKIKTIEAGHPVPDRAGLTGATRILELLTGLTPKDMVLCLLSGGGSALLPLPISGLTLEDKQITTRLLLACGATIQEINALRKHLSRIKGGQLARAASPARLVTLVLSDVIGDPPDVIASGPTVPDPTTFETCRSIIDKYQLASQLSLPVRGVLKSGYEGRLQETPKPHDPLFKRCDYVVVGNNRQALNAAQREARRIGFHPLILSSCMEGETREVAKVHVALAKEVLQSNQPVRRPACLISGGETTVTLRGKGKGGRNQEFALAAALEMEGLDGVLVLSGGTDGSDGSTDAAGAYADGETTERARLLGFDPLHSLNENDAYPLFQALEDLLITGPTRTNVMDIRLVLIP